MANPLYGQNKYDNAAEEMKIEHLDRVHYMNVAATSLDLSSAVEGNKTVIITAAMADDTYLRLPEATVTNGGMHIRVVLGIALADAFRVGFVTSNIIGGATAMGDTNEAAGGAADHASAIADVADTFKSVLFDIDAAATAGGTGGTVLDFYYTGQANLVVYSGKLISEVDAPTLTGHFSTTAANA